MDSLTILERGLGSGEPQPVYVLAGKEPFLKRQMRILLRKFLLGSCDDPFAYSTFPGERTSYSEVFSAVSTRPFLAPRRVVVVEDADTFVTANRPRIEKYVAQPGTAGVLILEVETFAATTKLAKSLLETTIHCKPPALARLPEWCVNWTSLRHGKQLLVAAARALVDVIGEDMGLLDMELEKLSVYVGEAAQIAEEDVHRLVSGSREEDVWQLLNRIADGDPGSAIRLLDGLINQGDSAFKLHGALTVSLRRAARAGRQAIQGTPLRDAMQRAGAHGSVEGLLRHLGRARINQLYDWMLDVHMLLRSTDKPPEEFIMEQFLVKLARRNESR